MDPITWSEATISLGVHVSRLYPGPFLGSFRPSPSSLTTPTRICHYSLLTLRFLSGLGVPEQSCPPPETERRLSLPFSVRSLGTRLLTVLDRTQKFPDETEDTTLILLFFVSLVSSTLTKVVGPSRIPWLEVLPPLPPLLYTSLRPISNFRFDRLKRPSNLSFTFSFSLLFY